MSALSGLSNQCWERYLKGLAEFLVISLSLLFVVQYRGRWVSSSYCRIMFGCVAASACRQEGFHGGKEMFADMILLIKDLMLGVGHRQQRETGNTLDEMLGGL